jgi:hypothetical protein
MDVTRQILILAAQAVRDPRSHRRPVQAALAAVHQAQRRLMIRHVGVHRADHAEIVGESADFFEHLAHFKPALAAFGEFERRFETRAGRALRFEHVRQRLAVVLVQHRLRVERIDVRGAAVHEEMHHALRLRLKMRPFQRHRVQRGRGGLLVEQRACRHGAKAHADTLQQFTTRQKRMLQIRSMMWDGEVHWGVLKIRRFGHIAIA